MTSTGESYDSKTTDVFRRLALIASRGNADEPSWEKPALLLILTLSTILNFWNLGINGWANYFYAAAVQAGTKDLTSAFFGSSDWGNSITVDKPPLSLWVMELSAKVFGFNPVSILAPQALMGVASTLLIYVIMRRNFSTVSALLAAALYCTTPIVVLMSRYNNPDPLMLLLMLMAVYLMQRAIAAGQAQYIIWSAAALGLGFMTKQLQALLVLPSLAIAYICWLQATWTQKLKHAVAASGVLALTGGIWMTVVDLIPPHQRPYVGGSPKNSVLELTFAYNGIDRVIQKHDDSAINLVPQQFQQVESDAGPLRLLNANYGQEIGWLLICGLVCTIILVVFWKMLPALKEARATAAIAVSWFVVTYLVLCFMGDQIHTYYTAALAPSLSIVIGIASDLYVRHRRTSPTIRWAAGLAVLGGTASSWLLLNSVVGWPTWLPTAVIAAGGLGASMLAVLAPNRGLLLVGALAAVCGLLCGPIVTSAQNVATAHNGSNPLSGTLTKNTGSISRFLDDMEHGEYPWAYNLAFGQQPSEGIVRALSSSTGCTWALATYASQTAARLQLESGRPVMPIGGFAGTDPSPTLQDFIAQVNGGEVCYFLAHNDFLAAQAEPTSAVLVSNWVKSNFKSEVLDGQILYDLRLRK
jgi:4-amino-4-deoxy-L-arabinose transferase-like glycosyltransferase